MAHRSEGKATPDLKLQGKVTIWGPDTKGVLRNEIVQVYVEYMRKQLWGPIHKG